jgi:cytochrome c biogenesis protein
MRILLRLLVSLKTAVIIICVLTFLAMLGTFIPQSLEAHQYLSRYPSYGHLIVALGFDDMYRSSIFQFFLWFLSVSTLVCILTRWKSTSRKLFNRIDNVSVKEIKAFPLCKSIELPADKKAEDLFEQTVSLEDKTRIGLRTSGKASLLGGMFIHIGFLTILAGGLIGVFYSVETVLRGRVGDKIPIPDVASLRAARDADLLSRKARNIRHFSPDAPVLDTYRARIEELHEQYHRGQASPSFKVAVNDLWVDYHKNDAGVPQGIKSWNSALSFIKNNETLASGVAKVNQPLSFEGYTFYQASWNKIYNRLLLKVDELKTDELASEAIGSATNFPLEIEMKLDEPASFSWSVLKFVVHDFLPDFRIIDGRFVSVSHELNNPAARIVAYDQKGGVAGRAWAFPDDIIMSPSHVSNLPFLFSFVGAVPEFETGLQLTYDPGKPVVWAGCLLFTLGLIMSFYIVYREEWLLIMPDGKTLIAITGNRPSEMLNSSLESLEEELLVKEQPQNPQETNANE